MQQEDILSDIYEEPRTAGIGSRIGAVLVDSIILSGIDYVISLIWGQDLRTVGSYGFSLSGFPALLSIGIWVLLIPVLEGKTGQTLGKRVLNIKVIKDGSYSSTIASSVVRHLFDFIDCIFLIGLIVAVTNEKRKRIGDLVAGTRVVLK